ncbi:hypothetical protein M422DRAFT_242980 [Sphaerobolus stellatus SS14]|nr:hypothetical protein M422DRAFT_242980 [Sphaerobolus stellatus SS14]
MTNTWGPLYSLHQDIAHANSAMEIFPSGISTGCKEGDSGVVTTLISVLSSVRPNVGMLVITAEVQFLTEDFLL